VEKTFDVAALSGQVFGAVASLPRPAAVAALL